MYKEAKKRILGGKIKKKHLKRMLRNSALLGGAGVTLAAGVKALDFVADKGPDPIKRSVGYGKMTREAPKLEKTHGTRNVRKYYNTLYHFSERTAMDPVAAAAWMKRSLQYKDIGPQTTDLKGLTDIEKASRQYKRKPFADSLSPGSLGALSNLG